MKHFIVFIFLVMSNVVQAAIELEVVADVEGACIKSELILNEHNHGELLIGNKCRLVFNVTPQNKNYALVEMQLFAIINPNIFNETLVSSPTLLVNWGKRSKISCNSSLKDGSDIHYALALTAFNK